MPRLLLSDKSKGILLPCRVPGGGDPPPTPDTFIIPRRQTLWPQLATTQYPGIGWISDGVRLFGGVYASTISPGDSLGWANVKLSAGGKRLRVLCTVFSGAAHDIQIWHNGVNTGAVLDTSGNPTSFNQIRSVTWSATEATGTLSLVSPSGKTMSIQQAEIVDLNASTQYGTSIDDLPWFGDAPPAFASLEYWNGSSWVAHTTTPVQDTAAMWGSYVTLSHANNWRSTLRFWCPQGTHTLNLWHRKSTSGGTITATLNGSATTPGTFSTSAGSTTYNNSTNLTYTAATTGMQTLVLSGSGGVACNMQWVSWRKSSALGAITPTGTTYGVESLELYPWFADSGNVDTLQIASDHLHYAIRYNSVFNAAGANINWEHGLLPGTYGGVSINRQRNDYGRVHVSENGGADLATFDCYNGTALFNQRNTFAAALSGGTLNFSVDSKNGLSTNYLFGPTAIRLTRTGA